jgi:hypothetical protein
MHPQVRADDPGDCPICHMALEPAAALPADPSASGSNAADAAEATSAMTKGWSLPPETANLVRYSVGLVRGHVLPQEVFSPATVEDSGVVAALLYKDEVASLAPGEHAVFFAASRPESSIGVERIPEPPIAWDRSTLRVRFRGDPRAGLARQGDPGWLKLSLKPRRMLVVPSTAVLESADGPYVLAYSHADRTFTRRPVEIGKVFSGFAAVVSGVSEREVIVAMNAFFLDAERRLREGADMSPKGTP